MITLSIDVTLLDKARFKEVTRRSGVKAQFCDLILIESPGSEYGDYMVKQSVTKQERANGVSLPILGNGKNFDRQQRPAGDPPSQNYGPQPGDSKQPSDSDVPF